MIHDPNHFEAAFPADETKATLGTAEHRCAEIAIGQTHFGKEVFQRVQIAHGTGVIMPLGGRWEAGGGAEAGGS